MKVKFPIAGFWCLLFLLLTLTGCVCDVPSVETKPQQTFYRVNWESVPCDITTEPLPETVDAVVNFFLSDTVMQVTLDAAFAEFYGEEIQIKAEKNMLKELHEGDPIRVTILYLLTWKPIPTVRVAEIEIIP